MRIGLRAEELLVNPLRPGLSAMVRIDTSKPGRSVLQPLTTTPADAYKTGVYDHQLDGADELIQRIIERNRQLKKP
jgi:membrane fusion protein (multidrug efflux system)